MDGFGDPLKVLVPEELAVALTGPKDKPKNKRSRNGCLSCKKLKIKCNEDKPHCDYCVQTNRECVYPQKPQKQLKEKKPNKVTKKRLVTKKNHSSSSSSTSTSTSSSSSSNKSPTPNSSSSSDSDIVELPSFNAKPLQKLNSMSFQLDVSTFELQLLKFYMDFGSEFFINNVSKRSYTFWENDVPKLWCESDLVKNALYTISSARLLAKYDMGEGDIQLKSVYLDSDKYSDGDELGVHALVRHSARVNLYTESGKYIKKTTELMNSYLGLVSMGKSPDTLDLIGQILLSKKLLTGSKTLYPKENHYDEKPKGLTSLAIYEILNDTAYFFKITNSYIPSLGDSRYSLLLDGDESRVEGCRYEFKYIQHLRSYVYNRFDTLDTTQFTYLNAINSMENGCKRTLVHKFPMALFKIIIDFAKDEDFVELFKNQDHLAMKIVFYVCCINTVFHFTLYQRNGMHQEFIEYYKEYSHRLFNGEFEEDMDRNFYENVSAGWKSKAPYDMRILKNLGRPPNEVLIGESEVMVMGSPGWWR